MNESEFNDLVDDTLARIEDALDDCEADIDCEMAGSVLTLTCEDGSAIIFSRQSASAELWLAARSGGFHFTYRDAGDGNTGSAAWYCQKYDKTLQQLFVEISKEQAGEAIVLD